MRGDVLTIVQPFGNDHVGESQRQRQIAAGVDVEMAVGELGGSRQNGVDGVELRPATASFHDEGPQVNVGSVDVGAPGEDELCIGELLRLGAIAKAQRFREADSSGGGADGPVEPGGSQPVEEAAVHSTAVDHPHGTGVAVRKDCFRPVFLADVTKALRNCAQSLIPGGLNEFAVAFRADSLQRVHEAIRVVVALQVLGNFAAEKAASDGMLGIAAEVRPVALAVYIDEQRTAVRAVQRANRMPSLHHPTSLVDGLS